jgi:hypothetical protein
MGIQVGPMGTMVGATGVVFKAGTTPSSGIPGRAGGTITGVTIAEAAFVLSGTTTATTTAVSPGTFVGFNLSSQPVSGSAMTLYALIWGMWICIWEDCSS